MKNTIFPDANHFQVPRALYVAAWKVWFKRFSAQDEWREGVIPLDRSNEDLSWLISHEKRFSVEVINRLLVPWSFRNQSQVNDAFFNMNQDMLKRASDKSSLCGECARLSDQALDYWDGLTYLEQDLFAVYAEARIQADIETPTDTPVVIDDAGVALIGEDIYPPVIPDKNASDEAFASAVVAWIDEDPFTPMYQRVAVADAMSSWHDRLENFFWPKPRNGLMQVCHSADALMYRAELLARKVVADEEWDDDYKTTAVKVAEEIFLQAGLPQRGVSWQNVYDVIKAAVSTDTESVAKMNSGWSLIASFVTHWIKCSDLADPSARFPMVCWNSRVATSVISRLDFLLVESGFSELGGRFENIGTVPGVGGTRPRELSLNWPDGYRSWKTQITASRFVNLMVNSLNTEKKEDGSLRYSPMPVPTGGSAPWTIQGVQLVLFSDGY